jgi:RNA polymerase subunit RPABC4/transcription elongation factor Spt4
MTFDPSFLSNFMLILTAWGGAFLAALWLSLIVWTYRDIRARARDPLGRILAVLVVAVLFLPGIVVYLILRPPRTLEDEYQHTLEEEALLQSIEEIPVCPGCARRIQPTWKICPNCHTRLKKTCHQCGKLMELPWNLCPFCGTPTPGMRREGISLEDALEPLAGIPLEEDEEQLEEAPLEFEGEPDLEFEEGEVPLGEDLT